MGWVPQSDLDYVLNQIKSSNEEVLCSQAPTTFFQAVWGDLWQASTTVAVGDVIHPPTQNGCVYECVTAGDTGGTEPGWSTTQDTVFSDGTAEWKTHLNYSLANQSLDSSDYTLDDDPVSGRRLTVAQKVGALVHTSGDVAYLVLIDTVNQILHYYVDAQTATGGSNHVDEGRTTLIYEHYIRSHIENV